MEDMITFFLRHLAAHWTGWQVYAAKSSSHFNDVEVKEHWDPVCSILFHQQRVRNFGRGVLKRFSMISRWPVPCQSCNSFFSMVWVDFPDFEKGGRKLSKTITHRTTLWKQLCNVAAEHAYHQWTALDFLATCPGWSTACPRDSQRVHSRCQTSLHLVYVLVCLVLHLCINKRLFFPGRSIVVADSSYSKA